MTQTDRDALLDAALIHAPFEGMNEAALHAGARDIGMDPALARVHFPRGGADLAAAYHRRADSALRRALEQDPPQGRIRDRVAGAVQMRLELADPELVRAGAAILALPPHAGLAARLVWETADAIWTGLGDMSEDVNWYSKRATLSAVISATVLFWLGDDSPGKADTRAFLNRRIEGVLRFEGAKARLSRLPGVAALARGTLGWVRAPQDHPLPGKMR